MYRDTTTFTRCREAVRELTTGDEPLEHVEEMLVDAPLSAEEKDALWLYSWALAERRPGSRHHRPARFEHGTTPATR